MTRSTKLLTLVAALIAVAGCDRQPVEARTPATARGNVTPVARVNLTVISKAYCGPDGTCGYNYRYDAYESTDSDGSIASYEWIENGVTVSTSATYYVTALRAYEGCTGGQLGTLRVTDNQGATASVCYGYSPL